MTDEIIGMLIRDLRYFSFASITVAFMCDCFRNREVRIFERITFTIVLTAFLAFYSPILDEGTKIFEQLTSASDSKIDAYLEKCRTVRFEGDSGFFDDFITSLQANFFKIILSCTCILRFISNLLQTYFIIALKIMAPIVLGLGAWEIFRNILWKFITYSLAVMMWSVGYQIADIFILKGVALVGVPSALGAGAGAVVITGGTALIGMLVFLLALLFGMCIFYILTPIVMFAILSGANPGTAVTGNMRTAAIAAMAGAGSAARIIQKSNVNVSPQVNRSIQSLSPKSPASPGISLNSVTKAMRLTK
jgi:hypothetical protein